MSEKSIDMMLTGIFNTVYVKGVISRSSIRNELMLTIICQL